MYVYVQYGYMYVCMYSVGVNLYVSISWSVCMYVYTGMCVCVCADVQLHPVNMLHPPYCTTVFCISPPHDKMLYCYCSYMTVTCHFNLHLPNRKSQQPLRPVSTPLHCVFILRTLNKRTVYFVSLFASMTMQIPPFWE